MTVGPFLLIQDDVALKLLSSTLFLDFCGAAFALDLKLNIDRILSGAPVALTDLFATEFQNFI